MNNTWTKPHISKIYEALGAIGDQRIELIEGKNEAKMYSSSRGKFYTVTWNDTLDQMMSNDNSAYYVGQLSYPMIAVLMLKGKVKYDSRLTEMLSDIKWKDINQKFKNDFDKTVEFVLDELRAQGKDTEFLKTEIAKIVDQVNGLSIGKFGDRVRPPSAY